MNLSVFKISKPIIGMLHLNGASDAEIHELAKFEIETLYKNISTLYWLKIILGRPKTSSGL